MTVSKTSEGWADVDGSSIAHYFIEGIAEPRGAWRALCFQVEVMTPTFEHHNPQCAVCAKIMQGSISDWRAYYERVHAKVLGKSTTQES